MILLIDDELLLLRALRRILRGDGHRVELASTSEEIEPLLREPALEVVLVDLVMGPSSGLEILERVKARRPEVEVLVMTGHASIESAVRCMRSGAFDYLVKPFDDLHRVRATVRKALERRRLRCQNRELEGEPSGPPEEMPELLGRAAEMGALVWTILSLQRTRSHILIRGERGTGKEAVARRVHASSSRCDGAFVPVDCGALPEGAIERELFGCEPGALEGVAAAPGLLRMADSGTLFLSEIGELPLPLQARLFRALQHQEVRPVGSRAAAPVDLRVIAATRMDLPAMVEAGRFQLDLYDRLNLVRLEIPPLRRRREDIPLLVHHLLRRHAGPNAAVTGIETDALETLVRHEWPGNLRELENAIESALALAPGPRLRCADLHLAAQQSPARPGALSPRLAAIPLSLEAYEKHALERALAEAGGDAAAAAHSLGIGRSTFYRKLAKHNILGSRRQRGPRPGGVGTSWTIG
jgi:DNA-binding NtrC family response regulator